MTTCIESTYYNGKGYAMYYDPITKKQIRHHRFVYEQHHGPIPKGMYVCHKCDNRPCINIDHLFLGTPQDNSDDMVNKGRHVAARASVKLTEAEVLAIRGSSLSGVQLGVKYNVCNSTIYDILNKVTWKHI